MKRKAFIAAALFLMAAGQTSAATVVVGVSFGPQAGPTNWTTLEGPFGASGNLIDENGAASSITLIYHSSNMDDTATVNLDPSTVPMHTPSLTLLNGNIDCLLPASQFFVDLSGLTPNSTYDVWVFAARAEGATYQTVKITGAVVSSFIQQDSSIGQLIVNGSVGSSAQDLDSYALPIEASASGTINVSITADSNNFGFAVSGLAIAPATAAAPEPATLSLLCIGIAAMAGYGWRKRKQPQAC